MLNMLASYFVYFCEEIAVLRGLAFAACLSTTFTGPQTLATDILNRFCGPIQSKRHALVSTDATNHYRSLNLALRCDLPPRRANDLPLTNDRL